MVFIDKFFILLLCLKCVFNLDLVKYTPEVETDEGTLTGLVASNGQYKYYGIPYATSERFQPPQPPMKWNGVFRAVERFASCAQSRGSLHFGKEDCLKLDVYAPENTNKDSKLPVLVFIHGGAFHQGAKWQYDPEFLVEKDVIVVIPQYRLGVLGFLCLNDVANLGLKDQLAALKWVQRNIAAFGGDPDNVTLSGESAGGASTSMHLLSKRSKGLFNKAIMMSGVALSPTAFNLEPLTAASGDAAKINTVRNEVDIYNTFLNAPLDDLLTATEDVGTDTKYFKYTPCVDTNFTDPFFHDTPYNIIKSGDFNKVPMMFGFTNLEGLLFYSLNNESSLEYLEDTFTDRIPSTFSWCSENDRIKIAEKLHSHYFGNQRIDSKVSVKGGVDMYSDWVAYGSVDAFSKLMAKYSDRPVYNYLFSYEGQRNFVKIIYNGGYGLVGATHADDLFYLFKPAGITLRVDDMDELLINKFTTMITNFVKYGDPTPNETELLPLRWPVTTANRSQVMSIDNPLSVSDMPEYVKGQFYLCMLCTYGLNGYVPCESAMQCNLE